MAAEVIAFALSLLVLYEVTTRGPQTIHLSPWSDGILQFGLHIDRLSSVMLVHIAAISILIHLFSIRYMQQERGYTRFHSLLAFTTFRAVRHGVERQSTNALHILATAELARAAPVLQLFAILTNSPRRL